MIDFSCPHCQAKLEVNDELAGKPIRCPRCQRGAEVPLPSHEAATEPPPNAAQSRVPDHVTEDAGLPPASRPLAGADQAILPPGTFPRSIQTAPWKAPDAESTEGATREVVTGRFVYSVEHEIGRGGMGT